MSSKNFESYVRTHRRGRSLSQDELSRLLGFKEGSVISRLESENREPRLKTAFALELLFGVSLVELFPALHVITRTEVRIRAQELYEALQGSRSIATRLKLDFFEEVLERIDSADKNRPL